MAGRITLPRNVKTISPANEQQQYLASIHGDKYDVDVHNTEFKLTSKKHKSLRIPFFRPKKSAEKVRKF